MTDLETRVRRGLATEPARRSTHDLLDVVRRDARLRRRRRTAALAVATAVVLVAAGGGLAWHGQQDNTADHPQSGILTGPFTVSVDAAGTAYQVMANEGCVRPCSSIWKSEGSGAWTKLAAIRESSPQAHLFGPVGSLEMAPNGHDGWAWGTHLWSTHDGGHTWTRVTAAPGATPPSDSNLDISPGPESTWALISTQQGNQLWRTPTGSDAWNRVALPRGTGQSIATVLPDSRIALPVVKGVDEYKRVRRDGKVVRLIERYDVGDGSGAWQRVLVPCVRIRLPLPEVTKAEVCGPGGHREGGGAIGGPKKPPGVQRFVDRPIEVGTTPPTPGNPLGHEKTVHVTPWRAVMATPRGAVPVRLHLLTFQGVSHTAVWGSHVVFLNGDQRIYVSDDGGRHWHED